MRKTRNIAAAGIAVSALFALAACNSGSPGGGDTDGGDAGTDGDTPWEVATDVQLEGSPTYDAMVERGGVLVGSREDQPGLGELDAVTGERSGFDVDIARWIAASLGFDEDDIEYTAVPSDLREQAIQNGDIDYMVGTYSITDERKTQVDFAGPYFVTGQGLLVATDSDIQSDADLTSDVVVCSVTGSTPIQNIRDNYDAETVELDQYSLCVEQLRSGQVDAVTTDEAILLGYAAQFPDEMQTVGEPFSVEEYGVGLPLGDDALRTHINDLFEDNPDVWQAIFDRNLGASGTEIDQPEVDRY